MKIKSLKKTIIVSILVVFTLIAAALICKTLHLHYFSITTCDEALDTSNNSKENSTYEYLPFDEAYSMLDYTADGLSNVERCFIMESKNSMLDARNVAMTEFLTHGYKDNYLWRNEANQWRRLADYIQAFIAAKMDEQWGTGKTGTAGSSYCSGCQFKLAITRAVFLETIIANPQEPILCDYYNLLQISTLQDNESSHADSSEIILNRIRDYLNTYISDSFNEWHSKDSFYDWHRETESTIHNLLTQLTEYITTSEQAIKSLNGTRSFDYLQYWLLEQVEQSIKIGDW